MNDFVTVVLKRAPVHNWQISISRIERAVASFVTICQKSSVAKSEMSHFQVQIQKLLSKSFAKEVQVDISCLKLLLLLLLRKGNYNRLKGLDSCKLTKNAFPPRQTFIFH